MLEMVEPLVGKIKFHSLRYVQCLITGRPAHSFTQIISLRVACLDLAEILEGIGVFSAKEKGELKDAKQALWCLANPSNFFAELAILFRGLQLINMVGVLRNRLRNKNL